MPQSLSAIRRSPGIFLLGVLAFAILAGWLVFRYLGGREPWQWSVDLEVYRDAGVSVLIGRPVYQHFTPTPQLLPFTYPPISALISIPLTFVPFSVLGWLWAILQCVLVAWIVSVAFQSFFARFGRWRPVAIGIFSGALMWMQPLSDGVMLGQVNVVLIALVLADYMREKSIWPRGMLIGIATAVKLTPGVFIIHLWVVGRRKEALTAIATMIGTIVLAFVVIPTDSAAYWFRALLDSKRLGSNEQVTNQALRGILYRAHINSGALWLLLIIAVAAVSYWWALRCWRAGNILASISIVGLLAVLLSPVAWIHHMAWVLLPMAVIFGDGRTKLRVLSVLGVGVFFALHLPDLGAQLTIQNPTSLWANALTRAMANCYGLAGILLIPFVAWCVTLDKRAENATPLEPDSGPDAALNVPKAQLK